MTKTKFSVDIHKNGNNSISIFLAISNHNAGKVPLGLSDFISYAQFEKAKYPATNSGFYIKRDEVDENIIRVSEDGGKTWDMTIEERIVHELDAVETNETQGEINP